MKKRLRAALPVVYGSLGAVLLASVPALGWLPIAVLAFALLHYVLIRRRHARSSRPEWWSAWYFAACQALIGVAIAATGGPTSPLIAWPLIAAATLPLRFTSRGGVAGLVFTTLAVLAATAGVDPAGFVREPTLVLMTLAVLASVAAFSSTLMRSELDHRSESVLDPLTGLLNRRALDARLNGLGRRAASDARPVCLILCDLDRFKEINDSHGHASGDAVIRAAADEIRGQLRSFESAYRIGGDEFVVLLPGVDAARGRAVAERLRLAVAGSLPRFAVTASLGVSAATGTGDRRRRAAARRRPRPLRGEGARRQPAWGRPPTAPSRSKPGGGQPRTAHRMVRCPRVLRPTAARGGSPLCEPPLRRRSERRSTLRSVRGDRSVLLARVANGAHQAIVGDLPLLIRRI